MSPAWGHIVGRAERLTSLDVLVGQGSARVICGHQHAMLHGHREGGGGRGRGRGEGGDGRSGWQVAGGEGGGMRVAVNYLPSLTYPHSCVPPHSHWPSHRHAPTLTQRSPLPCHTPPHTQRLACKHPPTLKDWPPSIPPHSRTGLPAPPPLSHWPASMARTVSALLNLRCSPLGPRQKPHRSLRFLSMRYTTPTSA